MIEQGREIVGHLFIGNPIGAVARLAEYFGGIVSRRREERHAVREMRVDPSKPPCRWRFQTAISCYGLRAAVVNVMVERRGH